MTGGSALGTGLWNPTALAVDKMGDVFVADNVNARVREIAAYYPHPVRHLDDRRRRLHRRRRRSGSVLSGLGGPATSASIGSPFGVVLDSAGDLYVTNSQRFSRFPPPQAPSGASP